MFFNFSNHTAIGGDHTAQLLIGDDEVDLEAQEEQAFNRNLEQLKAIDAYLADPWLWHKWSAKRLLKAITLVSISSTLFYITLYLAYQIHADQVAYDVVNDKWLHEPTSETGLSCNEQAITSSAPITLLTECALLLDKMGDLFSRLKEHRSFINETMRYFVLFMALFAPLLIAIFEQPMLWFKCRSIDPILLQNSVRQAFAPSVLLNEEDKRLLRREVLYEDTLKLQQLRLLIADRLGELHGQKHIMPAEIQQIVGSYLIEQPVAVEFNQLTPDAVFFETAMRASR